MPPHSERDAFQRCFEAHHVDNLVEEFDEIDGARLGGKFPIRCGKYRAGHPEDWQMFAPAPHHPPDSNCGFGERGVAFQKLRVAEDRIPAACAIRA